MEKEKHIVREYFNDESIPIWELMWISRTVSFTADELPKRSKVLLPWFCRKKFLKKIKMQGTEIYKANLRNKTVQSVIQTFNWAVRNEVGKDKMVL